MVDSPDARVPLAIRARIAHLEFDSFEPIPCTCPRCGTRSDSIGDAIIHYIEEHAEEDWP